MPRYFVDSSDGHSAYVDRDGFIARDNVAARKTALAGLPDMARDAVPDGDSQRFVIRLRDSQGAVLYSASLILTGSWTNNETDPVSADFKGHDRPGSRERPDRGEDKAR
ncbi:hypothetical protein AB6806_27990 [Bosea sp. RCC_152_1]|uniref:DUF6894 family protein n=1 Tax=Bosea sp. RCC_152_1 TaxID=3239228 RepID=UPI003523903F